MVAALACGCAATVTLGVWQWDHVALLLAAMRLPPEASLSMPVAGLPPSQVHDSWHAPRPGGRVHEGVDLFAPRGTKVLSATRGYVWRVGVDSLGGNVVWVLGEGRTLTYYAHLHQQAEGLYEGMPVARGAVLGLVGNTGNAIDTPPHLHFGVYRLGWTGLTALNPAPRLAR